MPHMMMMKFSSLNVYSLYIYILINKASSLNARRDDQQMIRRRRDGRDVFD